MQNIDANILTTKPAKQKLRHSVARSKTGSGGADIRTIPILLQIIIWKPVTVRESRSGEIKTHGSEGRPLQKFMFLKGTSKVVFLNKKMPHFSFWTDFCYYSLFFFVFYDTLDLKIKKPKFKHIVSFLVQKIKFRSIHLDVQLFSFHPNLNKARFLKIKNLHIIIMFITSSAFNWSQLEETEMLWSQVFKRLNLQSKNNKQFLP